MGKYQGIQVCFEIPEDILFLGLEFPIFYRHPGNSKTRQNVHLFKMYILEDANMVVVVVEEVTGKYYMAFLEKMSEKFLPPIK